MKSTIYQKGRFKVIKNTHGYIVVNLQGDYSNHSHFDNIQGAKRVIMLIEKRILPSNAWWQEAVTRLITEEEYALFKPNRRQAYYNCTTHISQKRR